MFNSKIKLIAVIGLFLSLAFARLAVAKPLPASGPVSLSLAPKAWREHYNVPRHPNIFFNTAKNALRSEPDGSLSLIFPDASSQIAYNYLLYPLKHHLNLSALHFISITVAESGTATFHLSHVSALCPEPPASAFIMIWGSGGWANGYRWWPTRSDSTSWFVLKPDQRTITVSLDPSEWTGIFGQSAVGNKGWDRTIHNVSSLGVTFSGGCTNGHGLFTTDGSNQFRILKYEIY